MIFFLHQLSGRYFQKGINLAPSLIWLLKILTLWQVLGEYNKNSHSQINDFFCVIPLSHGTKLLLIFWLYMDIKIDQLISTGSFKQLKLCTVKG